MILTNKAKYATIAVIDMLEAGEGKPVSLAMIALRQSISLSFLEQIFFNLKKAKIVKSVRGANGGYILIKNPAEVNIADVIFAVEKPVKMTRCKDQIGCIKKQTKCKTHHLWQGLEQNINQYLNSVSIADIYNQKIK